MLSDKPQVYIPRNVFVKLMYWIDKAPGEIGGMGMVQYDEENNYFLISDVYLLEQEVTGGTTDLDAVALGKLEAEVIKKKIKGDLNFWWHSHVNMSVFWSGTDKDTIKQIGEQGYCVATVFNKKREMHSAVYSRLSTEYGQKSTQMIDDLTTTVYDELPDTKMVATWEKDYTDKVKEKKFETREVLSGFPHMFRDTDKHPRAEKWDKMQNGKLNSSLWTTPTPGKVRVVLEEFFRGNGSKELTDAEKEWVVGAAAVGTNLQYFNYISDKINDEQWVQLEQHNERFEKMNPTFDWKAL